MSGGDDGESVVVEEEEKSEARPRRDGSPAMSVASAALEWDPSADVGAMGSSSTEGKSHDNRSRRVERNVLERFSECDVAYPPTFELEAGKPPSRPGSRSLQKRSKGYTYSTPSSSPVPLQSPQYSPVVSHSSLARNTVSSTQATSETSQNIQAIPAPKLDSSDDNNENDVRTEGKRTPGGRVVSGSSTDWEYDNEKNMHSKSLSQWQISGLTKSEVEYQTRKKNGSSTSIASSVLMLQVQTRASSSDQESPSNTKTRSKKPPTSAPSGSTDEFEWGRKVQKILDHRDAGSTKYFKLKQDVASKDVASSLSDPSSMCTLVRDYVKLLEVDSTKENIQYDVLKKHRDYHLMKVWKQISTLEKLNMQLLRMKNERSKSSKKHVSARGSRIGEGDAEVSGKQERKTVNVNVDGNVVKILTERNDLGDKVIALLRANQEPSVKVRTDGKPSRKQSSSESRQSSRKNSSTSSSTRISAPISDTEGLSDDSCASMIKPNKQKDKESKRDTRNKSRKENHKDIGVGTKPEVVMPRKSPIGFFVPLFIDDIVSVPENKDNSKKHTRVHWFSEAKEENGFYDIKGPMKIQDCLKENNPDCYQNIKSRDEFILHRKIDRQKREETLLRELLESEMPYEEMDDYLNTYLRYCDKEQKQRALDYLEAYQKRNVSWADRRVISSREMRERTARFMHHDTMEKQRKAAHERKKQAIRNSQKNFSKNLRRYQQLGNVNVPDTLKLGRIK